MHNDFDRLGEVFLSMCSSIDTPVSLGMWLRFHHGEFRDISRATIDPSDYLHADAFRSDYLVVNYIRKYAELPTGLDLEAEALSSFKSAEDTCRVTNLRFRTTREGSWKRPLASVFYRAQRKISRVLGPLGSSTWPGMCKWGPGATFSLSGDRSAITNKLLEEHISITSNAYPYLSRILGLDIHWLQSRGIPASAEASVLPGEFQFVPGSRLTTVPKDSKTDRTIAIEPTGNIFLQGGVGNFIRERLRTHAGINLNDQSINQNLAKRALTESLATVDLSSASDTISIELVRDILPIDWVMLLEDLRSPSYYYDGEWRTFRKHSSMGNGYTFELESLIFWALSSAVMDELDCSGHLSVFGDDIILPSSCYPLLVDVLDWAGFTVNLSKSFSTGLFYESCGKHFFDGVDVTPVYQKEPIKGLPSYYAACNRLIRMAFRMGDHMVIDKRLLGAWRSARSAFTPRHFIPLEYEDDEGLCVPAFEFRQRVVRYSHGASVSKVLQPIPRKRKIDCDGPMLAVYFFNGSKQHRRTRYWDSPPVVANATLGGLRVPLRGIARYKTRTRLFFVTQRSWQVWS